jgi:hypothetical protein
MRHTAMLAVQDIIRDAFSRNDLSFSRFHTMLRLRAADHKMTNARTMVSDGHQYPLPFVCEHPRISVTWHRFFFEQTPAKQREIAFTTGVCFSPSQTQ